ncbi:hypothetical protein AALP_AA5G277900 [Arabis alpina]|uniref:BHLH domain-containing protein n=1 Tax=Arabis alpina TaxID=50452 RepID=A0A087GZS9_ARAAL|nr:hypothetical protein AALP_AA5G277900 [Arabis alpina]
MERFQGHINPYFFDRNADVRSLEVEGFAEEESLQESIPFLKMLQSEEEPNFLALLSLQTLKEPWELESYLSRNDPYSPVQSETNRFYHNPISASSMEGTNQELFSFSQANMTIPSSSSASLLPHTTNTRRKRKISNLKPQEKRKRRKTKPSKNIEEIENQRINHIAVERNRRRTMNEYINSLRSLLPPTYIQRGDQASIVGGAINYVKVLEQIIQSLEAQKRQSIGEETNNHPLSGISSNNLWTTQENQTSIPKIEATMIQNHVNLKIQCPKKQGQLLKGIISLEKLGLTVLHLNIASSSNAYVSYSFNLKMEDDCDLGNSDEITAAVHRIFDRDQF